MNMNWQVLVAVMWLRTGQQKNGLKHVTIETKLGEDWVLDSVATALGV